jgi:hypothetical protein
MELHMKQALGVITGFILWSVLWLCLNQALLALGVLSPSMTQPLSDPKVLLPLLIGSVVISLISGYVTAMITGEPSTLSAAVLGVLLLLTGVYFQMKMWNLIPLWYNLLFLVLLIPMTFAGARVRARVGPRSGPIAPE